MSLILDNDPEVKEKICACVSVTDEKEPPTSQLLNYFSDWTGLKRVVAWIRKFVEVLKWKVKENKMQNQLREQRSCKQKTKPQLPENLSLTFFVDDLIAAEKAIVSFVQNGLVQNFSEEISALKGGIQKRYSHLYKLDPEIVGVLRVGGRLSKSALPEEVKHPVILLKSSHVSKLILRHVHEKIGHRVRNHMPLTLCRHYWIPHANSASRKLIKECVICQRKGTKAR